jgi:hypothetical protein
LPVPLCMAFLGGREMYATRRAIASGVPDMARAATPSRGTTTSSLDVSLGDSLEKALARNAMVMGARAGR